MQNENTAFLTLILLGLLSAAPVALYHLFNGLVYVFKKDMERNRQERAARAMAKAQRAQQVAEEPRERRSKSDPWKSFAAWNAYCYEEHQYYDRLHRGIY